MNPESLICIHNANRSNSWINQRLSSCPSHFDEQENMSAAAENIGTAKCRHSSWYLKIVIVNLSFLGRTYRQREMPFLPFCRYQWAGTVHLCLHSTTGNLWRLWPVCVRPTRLLPATFSEEGRFSASLFSTLPALFIRLLLLFISQPAQHENWTSAHFSTVKKRLLYICKR